MLLKMFRIKCWRNITHELFCFLLFSHVWIFVTHGLESSRLLSPPLSSQVWSNLSIEQVMLSNHLILSCPLLLLPSIFPSIRDFSNKSSAWIRRPKYWSFNFSISTSSEYSVLISLSFTCLNINIVPSDLKSRTYSSCCLWRQQNYK